MEYPQSQRLLMLLLLTRYKVWRVNGSSFGCGENNDTRGRGLVYRSDLCTRVLCMLDSYVYDRPPSIHN